MRVLIFLIVSARPACFNERSGARPPAFPLVDRTLVGFDKQRCYMGANAAPLEVQGFEVNDIGVKWVVTDRYGLMLEASREAADMLNLSVVGLRRRQLLVFFDGEREDWRQALVAAAAGAMVDREGTVRPREKRPLLVRAEITTAEDGDALLWTFTEAESGKAAAS